LLAVPLFACNRIDPIPGPETQTDTLSIEFNQRGFSNKSGEFTIDVSANCEWSFTVDVNWTYIIEPRTSYSGSKTLSIVVLKNESTSERTATYSFIYSGGKQDLIITQSGFEVYLTASENDLSFGYRMAEKVISINSNCGWEARSGASWVSIRPITGLVGNFEMTVDVETNIAQEPRSTTIDIWNDKYGLKETLCVSQIGKSGINNNNYIDEYGIDYGEGVEIGGLTWAPVNSGHHTTDYVFGKMFQWGRKSGTGYHDDSFTDSCSTSIESMWTGDNGKESPGAFYIYGASSRYVYDWIANGDDSFWNKGTEENPIKNTEYDPCPEGWRIPTAFEFKLLIKNENKVWTVSDGIAGYAFTSDQATLFLPASGRLNAADGLSYDRNIEGYYWTITANAGSSGYLFFNKEGCSVNYQGSRAGGCSVRCVKE